jgi:uncharacterized protein (DUF1330 family)
LAAYFIVDIVAVHDRERYMRYIQGVAGIVQRHGGRYLARGGETVPFAGDWTPERMIVIEFDSIDAARACFENDEYRAIAPLREESTTCRALFLEGMPCK